MKVFCLTLTVFHSEPYEGTSESEEFRMYATPTAFKRAEESLMEHCAAVAPLDQWERGGKGVNSITFPDDANGVEVCWVSKVTVVDIEE